MLNTYSQYARLFDDACGPWTKDIVTNQLFIRSIERYCNDILRARGWLFLRDVYEKLGMKVTKESCLVGWIYEENNKVGDNFVEFRFDEEDESPCIFVDFNVDGNIIDRL